MSRPRFALLYVAVPVSALLLAGLIGAGIVLALGGSPGGVLSVMVSYNFGSLDNVAGLLGRSTPLIFSGLAAAIGFRAGLFNIGVEGQYLIGTFTAAWAGSYVTGLSPALHLPLAILAGMAGGMLWAWIPIYLRTRRGVHEVISTIMLNFVASSLLLWLISDVFRDPTQGEGTTLRVRMPELAPSAVMPRMHGFLESVGVHLRPSVVLDWFFPLALAVSVLLFYLLWRTPLGYEIRGVGLNPDAATSAGISLQGTRARAFLLSGAVAGMVGLSDLMGYFGYLDIDFPTGYGFTGIAVALLGVNHPLGIVLAALLFSFLQRGGLGIQAMTDVPREVVTVLEGVVILTMLIAAALGGRWIRRMERRHVSEAAPPTPPGPGGRATEGDAGADPGGDGDSAAEAGR